MREDNRSAVWGGATLGLLVGLILGFFVGSYWTTVLYAVLIGAASGVAANILAWLGNRGLARTAAPRPLQPDAGPAQRRFHVLDHADRVLRAHSPAEFETTATAARECTEAARAVEDEEAWRAAYDSLDAFYAEHEARHPNIRSYASAQPE